MDMDAQTWQANALIALDHIAEQRALSEPVNTADIEELLSAYDDVVFDFSPSSSSSSSAESHQTATTAGLRMSWYNLVVGDVTDAVHTLDLSAPTCTSPSAGAAGIGGGFVAAGLRASFGAGGSSCSSPVERDADADWEQVGCDEDAGLDIEAVRQWCMERAAGSGAAQGQSVFRFEFGRYASAEMRRRLMVIG